MLGEDGRPDRGRIAQAVFGDREQLEWLEGLLHPIVSREYLTWREQLGALDDPPRVCVTEVPLLYEVGAEERLRRPSSASSAGASCRTIATPVCFPTARRFAAPTSTTSTRARSRISTPGSAV